MGDAFNGARFDTGGLWVTESVNLPSERNQALAVAGVVQNAGMRASVMRAAVTSGFGGPERLEVLDDVAVPEPAAGEVLVEVGACCCNNSDIWLREGSYGREDDSQAQAGWLREVEPPRFPLIQGADIVGRIVETGEGVDRVGSAGGSSSIPRCTTPQAQSRTASLGSSVLNAMEASPSTRPLP